jgi:hypothetical protein
MMSTTAHHSPKLQARFWEALSQGIPPAVAMETIEWDGSAGDPD